MFLEQMKYMKSMSLMDKDQLNNVLHVYARVDINNIFHIYTVSKQINKNKDVNRTHAHLKMELRVLDHTCTMYWIVPMASCTDETCPSFGSLVMPTDSVTQR